MTLNILFEEIKYGKEFVELQNESDNIQTFAVGSSFYVSKRIDSLLKECDMTKSFVKKLARAARNYKDYEDKILEEETVSSIYKRMKADSIIEDVNSALIELENKKLLRESNVEVIGKIVAALKYGVKNLTDKTIKEAPGLVESFSKKEISLIENVF